MERAGRQVTALQPHASMVLLEQQLLLVPLSKNRSVPTDARLLKSMIITDVAMTMNANVSLFTLHFETVIPMQLPSEFGKCLIKVNIAFPGRCLQCLGNHPLHDI